MNILEIEGIGPEYKEKLSAVGIHTTEELLKRGATSRAREEVQKLLDELKSKGSKDLKW